MTLDWNSADLEYLKERVKHGSLLLFLGAGFSFDATNLEDTHPPLGKALAQILADRCSTPYNDESLPIVFDHAQRTLGTQKLVELLRQQYVIKSTASWYDLVRGFVWNRIYTTNIDNLVQHIYSKPTQQRLRTIVCPADPVDRDPLFGTVDIVHLHGFVEVPQLGFTFTLEDFANQTARSNPWYATVADDLMRTSCLFVGTFIEEPPFAHYLALRSIRDRNHQEFRPKSFLIAPTIGPIRSKSLRDRNIVPLELTAADFFSQLRAALPVTDTNLIAVRKNVFPHITIRPDRAVVDETVVRYFDPIIPESLPKTAGVTPEQFFLGTEPAWEDIALGRDGRRQIVEDLLAKIKPSPARRAFQAVFLHGPAGSGKTTTIMRTAAEVARAGGRVYFARGQEKIDFAGMVELARTNEDGARFYIFVDIAVRHAAELALFAEELVALSNVTIVFADRSNAYFRRGASLAPYSVEELPMPDLVEADVVAILDRLEHFGMLGVLRNKSRPAQISAFMARAERQLLVAMREATSGKGFDIILGNEFSELPTDGKLAYVICSMAVDRGAPGVYKRHLMPCLDGQGFRKGVVVSEILRGILVPANQSGSMLKPRHRLIGHWIAEEIAPREIKIEATIRLLKSLSGDIVPSEITRRSPAYLAYRGMINCDGLFDTFGDPASVINVYEELRPFYDRDFLFWLQYGMAQIRAERLDVAENYFNQSLQIRPGNFQTLHHMGVLYLTQACASSNPATMGERANAGIQLLMDQIERRGDEDAYTYGAYLDHVRRWYDHAGSLIEPKAWEALRSMASLAMKKYNRDEFIREHVKQVEASYMMRAVKK